MAHSDQSVSFWVKSHPPFLTKTLSRDIETDVCVVGGGIAGLTAAYLLLREGKRVVVLERDGLGSGETGRTTAHITQALDERYFTLEKLHGRANAKLAARSHVSATSLIEKIVVDEGIECDFEKLPGFLVAGQRLDEMDLRCELLAARRAGVAVEWVERVKGFGPALKFNHQVTFHPMRYLLGLLNGIERGGGLIYTQTKVVSLDGSKEVSVKTEAGCTVRAEAVVIATHTPFMDRVVMHTKQAAYRSYSIAIEVKNPLTPFLLWDTEDPYHYARTARDDHGDHYLIVGGKDHKTGQSRIETSGEHFEDLENWARDRFSGLGLVTHRWSGQILKPVDGIGYAGVNPMGFWRTKNRYIITGHSGNGITHATLGAKLITDLVMKRKNGAEELYAPNRRKLWRLKEYVKENLNTALQYKDWLKDRKSGDGENLRLGQAAIVRNGLGLLSPIALYRDLNGEVHPCAAKCPHLGALVRWNTTEKTWDCPAHGSRFDCDGKVLNGPASSDLDTGSGAVSGNNPQPFWPEVGMDYE